MPVLDRNPGTTASTTSSTTGLIYDLADGNASMAALLGGKGAYLAEMTRPDLPVPPEDVWTHLARLEDATGRKPADPANPLLLSVRSGLWPGSSRSSTSCVCRSRTESAPICIRSVRPRADAIC